MTSGGELPSASATVGDIAGRISALHPYMSDAMTMLTDAPLPAGWIPLARLIEDRSLLIDLIDQRLAMRLASGSLAGSGDRAVQLSAVASAMYQTITWRALAPAVVIAVLHGGWEGDAPGAALRFAEGGSILMGHLDAELCGASADLRREQIPLAATLDAIRSGPWGRCLVPLAGAFREVVRFGPRQLTGNAASVVASTTRLLLAAQVIDAPTAEIVHTRIAATLGLTGFGRWIEAPDRAAGRSDALAPGCAALEEPWFRRSTCCLWFRVSAATCGDCSLRTPHELASASASWWAARRAPS